MEKACGQCIHKDLCVYQKEYEQFYEDILNMSIYLKIDNEKGMSFISLKNADWFDSVDLICKYFKEYKDKKLNVYRSVDDEK